MFPSRIELPISDYTLRPWAWSDKAALIHHAHNHNVSRALFDRFPFPYTAEAAERWLALATSKRDDLHFALDRAGEAIGGISAMRGTENARFTAEIGYWLGESHWGRGVMTAAVCVFRDALFAHTDLERLEAGSFITNHASQRVLEKSGFSCEGIHRRKFFKHGEFIDDAMYAVLRSR